MKCALCPGHCADADLGPLLDPKLQWLWEQVAAAADRRGNATLADGTLDIRAPESSEWRAAAGGLLGDRNLKAAQRRRINLAELTVRLRTRGQLLTPGAVAAHATKRVLATRAAAEASKRAQEEDLKQLLTELATHVPGGRLDVTHVWPSLRRSGWITRTLAADDPTKLLTAAAAVLRALPDPKQRIDRRRLASETTGDPHALDQGSRLSGLALALLVAMGDVVPGQRARVAWQSVGVDSDDVTGGLLAVGILPTGWSLPPGTAVTIPPRVLSRCSWPRAPAGMPWVFVTENPSVASAGADLVSDGCRPRILCMSGTPSALEVEAISRLAKEGWRIAVRADFDEAGLAHVAAVMKAIPDARPWRMGPEDYLASFAASAAVEVALGSVPEAPWSPGLSAAMRAKGRAAYEELILADLLEDLRRGMPRGT